MLLGMVMTPPAMPPAISPRSDARERTLTGVTILPASDEHPPAVDARLLRAHAHDRHPHAERRAQLAGRQRRSSPPGRGRRSAARAARRPRDRGAIDARADARRR